MTGGIPLLDTAITIADGRVPAGPDGLTWGLRSVHSDLTSSHGFRYPWPGQWAEAPGTLAADGEPCPTDSTGGLCAALTWHGMASGSIPALTLLLVGWYPADVLGGDSNKVRVRRLFVRDVLTIRRLLSDANLSDANLSDANLTRANLARVNLARAYLTDANLTGANLARANLADANLTGANLTGANLTGANLARVNLADANLTDVNLSGANLSDANLTDANLTRANLARVNLARAYLTRARTSPSTLFPTGFDLGRLA